MEEKKLRSILRVYPPQILGERRDQNKSSQRVKTPHDAWLFAAMAIFGKARRCGTRSGASDSTFARSSELRFPLPQHPWYLEVFLCRRHVRSQVDTQGAATWRHG